MSAAFDVVVIGAGHNGLTTAATLAKAGRKVLVLERRDHVGGLAASEQFHPGYRSGGLLHDSTLVRPRVISALGLTSHGLKLRDAPPSVLALGSGEGDPLPLHGRVDRAAEAIARSSTQDAERYREYHAFLDRLAPALRELFDRPPVDIVDVESESLWGLGKRALRVRRLGKADMMELLRLPSMCVADVLGEWFSPGVLQAALALPALAGTFTGPRSPGNFINLLRRAALGGPGVVGGGPMLVAALEKAARAAGVEIRTGCAAKRLHLGASGVEAVELADGERVEAKVVAASCHPVHTFCELMAPGTIDYRLEHRIRTFRSRGSVAVVQLALGRPPKFGDEPFEHACTGAHLDDLERAYDAIKYRRESPAPVLDIHVPTVADPSRAPEGHAVVSVHAYYAPHGREGGWDDAARQALGDRVVEQLGRHDAQLPASVLGRRVLTPSDLEDRYGLHGGHLHHGEHSVDQLLIRPSPECVRYRTPVPGLYLCGSGSHPGGGLTGAPGELAAAAIMAAR